MRELWATVTINHLAIFNFPAHAIDFLNVTDHTCYDGDTCKVTIAGLPEVFGDHISIRLKGIDTPEIRGKCSNEKAFYQIEYVLVPFRIGQV